MRGTLAGKWQLWYQDCPGDTLAGGDTPQSSGISPRAGHWGDHLRLSRQTDWHVGVTTVTSIETELVIGESPHLGAGHGEGSRGAGPRGSTQSILSGRGTGP